MSRSDINLLRLTERFWAKKKRPEQMQRAPNLKFYCGVEGSRTPVQTKLPLVFYMFIVLLFVGNQQEKHKPIDYLAVWYLNKRHSLCLSHPFLF